MESVLDDAAKRQLKCEHFSESPVIGGRVESPRSPLLEHCSGNHVSLDVFEDFTKSDVSGLRSSQLNFCQTLVVSADRSIMLDVQPSAIVFQNVKQRNAGRIILNQSHLRRHSNDAWNCDVQESLAGFFGFRHVAVKHSKELQDSLFAACIY